MLLNKSLRSFSFLMVKDCVMEPTLVKTVSYFKVSALVLTIAVAAVVNESFLQDGSDTKNIKSKTPIAIGETTQYFDVNNFIFQM